MSNKTSKTHNFQIPDVDRKNPEYMREYMKRLQQIPAYCKYCNKTYNSHSINSHIKTKKHKINKENNEIKEGEVSYKELKEKYEELKKKYKDLLELLSNIPTN